MSAPFGERKIAKRGTFKAKELCAASAPRAPGSPSRGEAPASPGSAPSTLPRGVRGNSPVAGADPTTSYLDVIPEARGETSIAKSLISAWQQWQLYLLQRAEHCSPCDAIWCLEELVLFEGQSMLNSLTCA